MRQRINSKQLEELLYKLHATATIKSQPTYSYSPWDYNTASEYDIDKRMKVYDTVELQLPLDKLTEVAEVLYDVDELQRYYGPGILEVGQRVIVDHMMFRKEQRIRDNNPAVQKAWEHYQTMLNLVRNDND